jgi:hypothetical protein
MTWEGRELGNAAAAGRLCGTSGENFQWYSNRHQLDAERGRPHVNPAPVSVCFHPETGEKMYPLAEVQAWHLGRPGRGNWPAVIGWAICHTCGTRVMVWDPGVYARHHTPDGLDLCASSREKVTDFQRQRHRSR